ncbi:MAG: tripartite tricarboxylate transporter substrate binding protein [Burkholderiales bacterium]|nr:tripartite tricarboxylate transporter substrate binding protein [Burkholderiales bacterium]
MAQAWPAKPIRIVVPYGTGGGPDILARLIGQKIGASLGASMVIENKPGAAGNLGADAVAKAPPDGYTLLLTTTATQSINPALYPSLPFDAQRDFTAIGLVALTQVMLVVANDVPAKSLRELLALARAQPGKLTYATAGPGTMQHMASALLDGQAGIQTVQVPYKGTGQLLPDLVAGRVNMMFNSLAALLPMVRDGKLRALAVTGTRRSAAAPDVPTFAEAGLPGFDASAWYGVFGPAGLPREIVARLAGELARAVDSADLRERYAALGLDHATSTPEELERRVRDDFAKWSAVIKANNITAQ